MMFSQKPFYSLYKIGKKKWFYKILTETLETYWTKNPDFISFLLPLPFDYHNWENRDVKWDPLEEFFMEFSFGE